MQLLARRWMATAGATAAAAATSQTAAAHQPRVTGARALARDLKQLSKARLSLLVALTASTGYVLGDAVEGGGGDNGDATTPPPQNKTRSEWWRGLAATTAGTWLAAASANALNQLYEVRNDAAMKRTCMRPLPAGRLTPAAAAAFALVSGAAGVGLLWRETNATTAGLGAANIVLYAGVYTPLKQVTVANTWVGAVVGAIPPLMGWAAATGAEEASAADPSSSSWGAELRHPGAWVLALGLFSWQMPHFMALAWLCREDYRAGGFRMLSTLAPPSAAVVAGATATTTTPSPLLAARELAVGRRVAAVALRHSLALVPLGLAAAWLGLAEPGWHSTALSAESAALAAAMTAASAAFYARPDAATARRAFRASLAYLPLLMLGMVVHRRREDVVGAELRLGDGAALPPPPPPARTWAEVRERLADAGWWWTTTPVAPLSLSVRLRLRSPEERVAAAVLAREEEEGKAQARGVGAGPAPAATSVAASASDLITELRAALGLTHCPSRVYGEAVEGAEEEQEEQVEAESEKAPPSERRRWWQRRR
jgi:protoheme IX farnesyltransferase